MQCGCDAKENVQCSCDEKKSNTMQSWCKTECSTVVQNKVVQCSCDTKQVQCSCKAKHSAVQLWCETECSAVVQNKIVQCSCDTKRSSPVQLWQEVLDEVQFGKWTKGCSAFMINNVWCSEVWVANQIKQCNYTEMNYMQCIFDENVWMKCSDDDKRSCRYWYLTDGAE